MARVIATAIGAVLAFATVARAQTPATDEVVLVTGEVLQGTLISASDDPDLVISLVDGTLRRVPLRLVRALTPGSPSSLRSLALRDPVLEIMEPDAVGDTLAPCAIEEVALDDSVDAACPMPYRLDAVRV